MFGSFISLILTFIASRRTRPMSTHVARVPLVLRMLYISNCCSYMCQIYTKSTQLSSILCKPFIHLYSFSYKINNTSALALVEILGIILGRSVEVSTVQSLISSAPYLTWHSHSKLQFQHHGVTREHLRFSSTTTSNLAHSLGCQR